MQYVIKLGFLIAATIIFGQLVSAPSRSVDRDKNKDCFNCAAQNQKGTFKTNSAAALLFSDEKPDSAQKAIFFTEKGTPVRLVPEEENSDSYIQITYQRLYDSTGQKVAIENQQVVSLFAKRQLIEKTQPSSVRLEPNATSDNLLESVGNINRLGAESQSTHVLNSSLASLSTSTVTEPIANKADIRLSTERANQGVGQGNKNLDHMRGLIKPVDVHSAQQSSSVAENEQWLSAGQPGAISLDDSRNNKDVEDKNRSTVYDKVVTYGIPAAFAATVLKSSDSESSIFQTQSATKTSSRNTTAGSRDRLVLVTPTNFVASKIVVATPASTSDVSSEESTSDPSVTDLLLASQIDDIEDDLSDLTETVTDVSASLTDVQSDVSTLQTQLGSNNVDALAEQLNALESKTFAGIAASSSLVTAIPSEPGKTILNIGSGYYEGETAIGVSLSHRLKKVNGYWYGGVASGVSEFEAPLIRAGVGIEF
ncbi:MAG: YadA C-terminal domain-containing protein [Acidiferrobacterales bacterium]|nr:YadA C-terminal domain-containing protein [Acidiferrobacterales bacterium]